MTKREKRLERIRQNPKTVSFQDLKQTLEDYGFTLQSSSGSHHIFRVAVGEQVWKLVIPFKKPHIKPHYVKDALNAIDEVAALQTAEQNEDDSNEN